MAKGVPIIRTDLDAAGLRRAAANSNDEKVAQRMCAAALVLEGKSRVEVASQCGIDTQRLRHWIHRYNKFGVQGLYDRLPSGAKRSLSKAQEAEVGRWLSEGPYFDEHEKRGRHWRREDIAAQIKKIFGVELSIRSITLLGRRLGISHLGAHPGSLSAEAMALLVERMKRSDLQSAYRALKRSKRPW